MKKRKSISIIVYLLSFLLFVNTSIAFLTDIGNGVIQDDKGTLHDHDDQYWIRNLHAFVDMTYDEQISAIKNIDNRGLRNITDWHMATYADILTLFDFYEVQEIADAFEPTRVYSNGYISWEGRYDRKLPNYPIGGHYEVIMQYHGELEEPYYGSSINIGVADSAIFPGAFVTAYFSLVLDPIPDIKANNSDGPITIQQSDTLSVTIELDAGGRTEESDWWLVADTPFGWYLYLLSGVWNHGFACTYQGSLFDLNSFNVLNTAWLSAGKYTFYFGVDLNKNCTLDMDQIYYDSVEVTVNVPQCTTNEECPIGQVCRSSVCENCICPDVWDPVCGVDGQTYGNACEAECAHIEIAHSGEC